MASAIDRCIGRGQDAILLIGRLALAALFVESSFHKLADWGAFIAMLANQGAPMPEILAVVGVLFEAAGTIGVVLGARTRASSLLLIAFTAAATVIAHHFWTLEGAARAGQAIHFMKNVAIIGGFLILSAAGPGRFSLDHRRSR